MLANVSELGPVPSGGAARGVDPRWGVEPPEAATFAAELEYGLGRLGSTEVELTAYLVDVDGLPDSEVSRMANAIAGETALWWMLSDGRFVAVYLAPVEDLSFMTRAVEHCLNEAVGRIGAFAGRAQATVRALRRWSYQVVMPGQLLLEIQCAPADLVRVRMPSAA